MTPHELFAEGCAIPAHPLALTADRKLDERRQKAVGRYYAEAGSGGMAVGVHTTQFPIHENGMLRPVLEIAMEVAREAGRTLVMVAGVQGDTAQAVAEARQAAELGYHLVLLRPSAGSDDELIARAKAVGEVLPVIGFYLQPAVGGRVLSQGFWQRFASIESVAGIKVAPFDRYRTLDVLHGVARSGRAAKIAMYTGNDNNILGDLLSPYALRTDAGEVNLRFVGGLLGQFAVWTQVAAKLVADAHKAVAGDNAALRDLMRLDGQLTDANAAIFDVANGFHGCIAGINEVLARQGLLGGRWCLDPHEDLSPGQAEEISRVARDYPHLTDDAFIAEKSRSLDALMIGTITPAEWIDGIDPDNGRRVTRLTCGTSNSYALYYFVPSVTPDGRFLVFHSERSGEVQLYRLDLATGEIGQLTDGHTRESGWAVWCEWHLDGIYNHLSAIHPQSGEVFYFEDDVIRATNVASFANRVVARLPAGRMPIGQAAFSPDGRWFGYIHTDAAKYRTVLLDREKRKKAGTFSWEREHHTSFRNAVPSTLALVDTETGEQRVVIETDYHFHHVLFADNRTILLNHPKECAGMWVVDLDGGNVRHLRPADAPGAHGAMVNHQVITARGIAYEAVNYLPEGRKTYLGMYDPATDRFEEDLLPAPGYVHVGFDPAGRFAFVESSGTQHQILAVHRETDGLKTTLLRRLSSPDHDDQRHHAHPFLAVDRKRLYFTDWSTDGFAQICAMDVTDLVEAADRLGF